MPCATSAAADEFSTLNFLGCIDADDDGDLDLSVCAPAVQRALRTGEINPHDFPTPPVVAPIPQAPGFPQTETVTREQYNTFRQYRKERNEEARWLSCDALANVQAQAANNLANIVEPSVVTYDIRKLKQSRHLMDKMRLDLSGASSSFVQQLEKLQQAMVDAVVRIIELRFYNQTPPHARKPQVPSTAQVTPNTNASSHAPPITASPHVEQTTASQAPIRRVAVTTLITDNMKDLPYELPVNWAAQSSTSHTDLVAGMCHAPPPRWSRTPSPSG
jgi:hypothetical protein